MKVCHLITGLGIGGAEYMLLKTLPRLKNENFIISLTDDGEIGKKIEQEGIKVHYLGLKRNFSNLIAVVVTFGTIIRREKPDILNSYLIHSNLFGRIFGRIFGVKKIICSVRNKHIDKPILTFIDRITSGLVDIYTPNSEAIVPFMIEKQKIPRTKIKIIENGIDVGKFSTKIDRKMKRNELGLGNEFVITCVAKLEKQKGHETLLHALKGVNKNYTLLLVGDGKERKMLEKLAKELGIDENVRFLGKRSDVTELLKITDLFVLPSNYEGMSNALLEAMASKCNCLVSDIDENKAVLKNAGEYFEQGSSDSLRNKILTAKTNNGKKAYDRSKEFDINMTIKKLQMVWESVRDSRI